MFPGNCFSLSFLCWLVCLDRAVFAPHRGQVRIYPGAKASPGLSKNLQVMFLSPSGRLQGQREGRLHFLDSFAESRSHLCCSGSLSWCSYVRCFPPSSPCVLATHTYGVVATCQREHSHRHFILQVDLESILQPPGGKAEHFSETAALRAFSLHCRLSIHLQHKVCPVSTPSQSKKHLAKAARH